RRRGPFRGVRGIRGGNLLGGGPEERRQRRQATPNRGWTRAGGRTVVAVELDVVARDRERFSAGPGTPGREPRQVRLVGIPGVTGPTRVQPRARHLRETLLGVPTRDPVCAHVVRINHNSPVVNI